MQFATVIALNYLAHARVLARSLAGSNPSARLAVLVIDADVRGWRGADESFDVVRPSDLELSRDEFLRMAAIYEPTELATAVKPWVLRLLLDRGAAAVLFLDPDVEVFAPVDDFWKTASETEVLLVPHLLRPLPRDGMRPTEDQILLSGAYNLGFVGVGRGARPFLDWWAERLRRDCFADPATGHFYDQRWLDLVPGYFETRVIRDPGCNVGHWNIDTVDLAWTGEEYRAGASPLRIFHFSGFPGEGLSLLSRHQGDLPRKTPANDAALSRLCFSHLRNLRAAGFDEVGRTPYGFAVTSRGLPIDRTMRLLARHALLSAEALGGSAAAKPVPLPFDVDAGERFLAWLRSPSPTPPRLPRYLAAVHALRSDLQTAYPDPLGADAEGFAGWVERHGRFEGIPDALADDWQLADPFELETMTGELPRSPRSEVEYRRDVARAIRSKTRRNAMAPLAAPADRVHEGLPDA